MVTAASEKGTDLAPGDMDVLCVGSAVYDLNFEVAHHPQADEKIFAEDFVACGGGPAANAAIAVARLGLRAGFGGYLGNDLFGQRHLDELLSAGVDVSQVIRGAFPTPLSAVLVKPDGARSLVNYKGDTQPLPAGSLSLRDTWPKLMLFDGHEPHVSVELAERARNRRVPSVLDAGSMHPGTQALMKRVDYLIASEKFAGQYLGRWDEAAALRQLAELAPCVAITLGERGLIWARGGETGRLPAFAVDIRDTTGAGDAMHGAFAAALAMNLDWLEALRWGCAAGALCCTKIGARPGLPYLDELRALLR